MTKVYREAINSAATTLLIIGLLFTFLMLVTEQPWFVNLIIAACIEAALLFLRSILLLVLAKVEARLRK